MFCRFCGNLINENATFCAACGQKVVKAQYQPQYQPQQTETVMPQEKKQPDNAQYEPRKKGNGLLVTLVLLLLILLVGATIVLGYNKIKGKDSQKESGKKQEEIAGKEDSGNKSNDKKVVDSGLPSVSIEPAGSSASTSTSTSSSSSAASESAKGESTASDSEVMENTQMYVSAGKSGAGVRARTAPSTEADTYTVVSWGTPVDVVCKEGQWYGVLIGTQVCYIREDCLTTELP